MSSNSRVLRSNSQTSPHKPISTANTISASNTITTLSTLTDLSTATCESMENGHNSQTPLPLDDEWAANLRRVVFVPSEAPAIAKNLDSRHLNRSPAHIMLFPRPQEDALAMGIRMKYNNNASPHAIPPAERRKALLLKRANSETQAMDMDVDSQVESEESLAGGSSSEAPSNAITAKHISETHNRL